MFNRSISPTARLAALSFAFAGLAAASVLWHPATVAARPAATGIDPASVEFYLKNVQPILQTNCYRCHGAPNHRGGLTIDTKAGLLKGGHDGPVIVPGDPGKSLLISLIRHEGPANDPMPMPPKDKLSDADIATITTWIKAGAVMPTDTAP